VATAWEVGFPSFGPNDRLFADQEMEVGWQRATCEPLEPTEPRSVSLTNSGPGILPTAAPPRRRAHESRASARPEWRTHHTTRFLAGFTQLS
jgi:hypothetical protein